MSITSKHAYLIIAHANPYVLEKLLLLLDDERNDIFVHIDKKSKSLNQAYYQNLILKSNLKFIDRIEVYWGNVSQIKVELNLFRAAYESGEYAYYHLISGADLPLVSQDHIHDFFKKNEGKQFLGFSDSIFDEERINKLHLFPKYLRATEEQYLLRVCRKIRNVFLSLQRLLKYRHGRNTKISFVYGSNWGSFTNSFVGDLLKQQNWILDFYSLSNCGDEIYKQTFAYNSDYINTVYAVNDELESCQRYMDWKRGRPYTFRIEDYSLLMNSGLLFARKFDESIDREIVDAIYQTIKEK